HVRRGQPIALIGTEQLLPGGGALDEDILASVETESSMLAVQLESLEATAPLEIATLVSERERLVTERNAAGAQAEAAKARLGLARERLDTAEGLASRGYLAGDQLRQRRSDVIAMEESRASATEQVRGLGAQISGLDARIAKAPHDARAARAQLQGKASQLTQTRAQIAGRRGYELRAPSDGRITALQAGLGQIVDPTKPLMTLTPMNGRLRAELYVPSRAIGFIRPGQRVRLLYDAYPYQKFGPAWGRIIEISATVLGPQEIAAVIQTSEPVYRVVAQMDRQSMQAFGEPRPLSAGMALTADIILEERTFAEWLLEPLLAMRGRTQQPPESAASS
ncbi:MAG TPA: HlyD family efflux transporter periplasmic adaptor subunit, partial [Brevundimonas sp.]